MNLQMLKKAMLAYVSAVKFIWSSIAYPLSIVGKKFMNLRGYRVYGNSIQDGTPTPDNPVEIESVGDLSTKNLFDISDFISFYTPYWTLPTEYGYHDEVGEECLKVYGAINADGGALYYMKNRFKENTSYTFSLDCYDVFNNNMSGISFACRYTDETSVSMLPYQERENKIWKKHSFTSDPNKTVMAITVSYGTGYAYSYLKNLQIEEGTTATDYEPYHKYKIPVVASGKNMATAQQVYSTAANYSECTEDGRNCIRCTSAGKSYAGINFKTNTQYTVRFEAKTVARSGYEEDGSPEALFAFTHTDGTRKVIAVNGSKDWAYYEATSLANKTIASVGMYAYNYKHWIYINIDTFQIEEGTPATEYEPYIPPVTTNIFLDEPLRKVGDYADYVDFEKQKVVRNVKEVTFNGTEDWRYNDTNNVIYLVIYKLPSSVYCYSTHFLSEALRDDTSPYFRAVTDILILYQRSNNIVYPSADEFKTFLQEQSAAGTPLIVHYILKTPTEETVNLPALPQFKGTTIYEVGTNIKPSGMEAKYC